MVRKHDPVTGEEFECTGDTGHCWCFDLPLIEAVEKGRDCKGPEHLKRLLQGQQEKTGKR